MKLGILAGAALLASSFAANAITVTTDDLTASGDVRVVGGPCPDGASSCFALNTNEVLTLSFAAGTFSMGTVAYTLQGSPANLEITSDFGTFSSGVRGPGVPSPTTFFADLGNEVGFSDITFLRFDNIGTGNLRIGAILGETDVGDPAAVPLPAAGLMLLTALGGAAAMRRRAS